MPVGFHVVHTNMDQDSIFNREWWSMPEIPTTEEVEIGGLEVQRPGDPVRNRKFRVFGEIAQLQSACLAHTRPWIQSLVLQEEEEKEEEK